MSRHYFITASDIPSILEKNPNETLREFYKRKSGNASQELHTPADYLLKKIGIQIYNNIVQKTKKSKTYKKDYLCTNPDAEVKSQNILVECATPFSRSINYISEYHKILLQAMLNISGKPKAHFIQCKFEEYKSKTAYKRDKPHLAIPRLTRRHTSEECNKVKHKELKQIKYITNEGKKKYWKLTQFTIFEVNQDREWFKSIKPTLNLARTNIKRYRAKGLSELNNDFPLRKRKRGTEQIEDISKKRLTDNIKSRDWQLWVSPSAIFNYMRDDPLLDWLKLYASNETLPYYLKDYDTDPRYIDSQEFMKYLMNKGIKFEDMVMKHLYHKFPNDIIKVGEFTDARSNQRYLETIEFINKKTPIIYQAVLHNQENKTYGMPDLLVRSDYMPKIFKEFIYNMEDDEKNTFYYVIDIKYHTLGLKSDGFRIGGELLKKYRGQLWIYNEALSKIQNYNPNKAFILGRAWSYKSRGLTYTGNEWFDRLGCIDFLEPNGDEYTNVKVARALQWIRDLRKDGENWSLVPPTRDELRPNMCNKQDAPYGIVKQALASETADITELWQCGVTHRAYALENNIKSWKDPRCTSVTLNRNSETIAPILNQMLKVNRGQQLFIPKKIKTEFHNWRNPESLEFYIDFEFINNVVSDKLNTSGFTSATSNLFMIGVGHIENGEWQFRHFTTKVINEQEEERIFKEFHEYVYAKMVEKGYDPDVEQPRFIHWYRVEWDEYHKAFAKFNMSAFPTHINRWFDLQLLFKQEPISIKGSLGYGLKSIAKAMYSHGMIETVWDGSIDDGLSAMVGAWKASEEALEKNIDMRTTPKMRDIIKYNEVDCKTLYEILDYLRKYH